MMVQPASLEANRQLAQTIISNNQGYALEKEVKEICSADAFIQDPTAHLINEMIKRGSGGLGVMMVLEGL